MLNYNKKQLFTNILIKSNFYIKYQKTVKVIHFHTLTAKSLKFNKNDYFTNFASSSADKPDAADTIDKSIPCEIKDFAISILPTILPFS